MLIQTPPQWQGDERQQLIQVRSYLYQMAEALNAGLTSLTADNFTAEAAAVIKGAASQKELNQNAQTLKAMVIKTAAQVTAKMDEITARLEGEYVSQSEFGQYREDVTQEIKATATGVVQEFGYDTRLDTLDESMAGFLEYEVNTQQYIKTGLLYFDDEGVPRYGVAVGEADTEITEDGQTVVSRSGLLATFTSDRLTFWQNGVETAWISNGQWCTRSMEIKEDIHLGMWQVDHKNGFCIRWLGE